MTGDDGRRMPDPARDPLPLRGRAALVTVLWAEFTFARVTCVCGGAR